MGWIWNSKNAERKMLKAKNNMGTPVGNLLNDVAQLRFDYVQRKVRPPKKAHRTGGVWRKCGDNASAVEGRI
jgi:hypothetical protein